MSERTVVRSNGIGVFGIVGIIFLLLKLFGVTVVATWPWIWVLAPFWIPIAISLVILTLAGIAFGIAVILDKSQGSKYGTAELARRAKRR